MYGCLVIGPSGSGKTTLCNGLSQFFHQIDRPFLLINLDPANENLPYTADIDIRDLIQIDDIMETFSLGPNGALIYAIKFLLKNIEWLIQKIKAFPTHYCIFDLAGQIELYINNEDMKKIIQELLKTMQLVSLGVFDSYHCCDSMSWVSASLMALSMMIQMETPHINILSKVDLLKQYGSLPNSIRFYLENNDLSFLGQSLLDNNENKYTKLNKNICDLVEQYSMVGFTPLFGILFYKVENKVHMCHLVSSMDKSNGYFYCSQEKFKEVRDSLFSSQETLLSEIIMDLEDDLQEKYEDNLEKELKG